MSHAWLPYLPPHLAADLLAHPDVSPLERALHQPAVALFADISGFTPMSEALGRVGAHGTEELSQILNHTFGAMIAIIHRYAGSVGKIAGDALMVVFPYSASTRCVAVRRAIQCALEMQGAMSRMAEHQTSAGSFRLAMKIGLGQGYLLTTTIGDEAIRLEYLLAGSAIDRSAAAEQHAANGAVVICDDLLDYTTAHAPQPVAPGFHQITRLARKAAPARHSLLLPLESKMMPQLVRYLPPVIADRLAQGQQNFIDEHRTITTLFVRFDEFDYQDRACLGNLQRYLREVVQISNRYGGYLRQVDVGDKGSLFILLFGAPLAHEDDAERGLLCALALREVAQHHGITTACGMTTGQVFCGLVGSEVRREYAAIGDSVNLAARLMSTARGQQILVDAATRDRVGLSLVWQELAPLTVKGKSATVAVAALLHGHQRSPTRLRAPSYALLMVGRQDELHACIQLLERVYQGTGHIVGITAEAGMGKSRLVAEIMRSPTAKRLRFLSSECLSYGTTTSYLVWQRLFYALFDLPPDLGTDIQIERVQAAVAAIDPSFSERVPLIGALLNLPIPETDFTRSLDPEQRKRSLHALLISCLRAWAKQQPLFLILEDCHWIDDLSDELLYGVAQRLSDIPLLLLITYRPLTSERTEQATPLVQVRNLPHYREFQLAEFSDVETAQLIDLKLEQLFGLDTPLPHGLRERIVAQAQGNPFYIDELLNLLHDRDIDLRDTHGLVELELPDSLQRLILSRIDRLEEAPKTTLKVASIIGRLFRASWLWQLAPQLGTAEQVHHQLARLQQCDLTQLERAEPELEYLFKHIITREVAYESLSFATRTQLHEQVGGFIEQTYAHELERWLDVLAYHYGNTSNVGKQGVYFRKAGAAAQQRFANAAAIYYYQRLLNVLPEAERGEVLAALSEVEYHIGQWHAAEQHARAAMALAHACDDDALYARAAATVGHSLRSLNRLEEAVALLEPIYHELQRRNIVAPLPNLIKPLLAALHYLGRSSEALALGDAQLRVATLLDNPDDICAILAITGMIHMEQGRLMEALPLLEQGLAIATTHQLQSHLPILLANLGAVHGRMGDYAGAHAFVQQQIDLMLRIGHPEGVAHGLGNLAMNYYLVGMEQHAYQCTIANIAVLGEELRASWVVWGIATLIRLAVSRGALAEASALHQRGLELVQLFGQPALVLLFQEIQVEIALQQQHYQEAQTQLAEELALYHQLGRCGMELCNAQLLAIRLQFLLGQLDAASAVAQVEDLQQTWSDARVMADARYTIWQIDPSRERDRTLAAEQYRAFYTKSSEFAYRKRYRELTGGDLPDPPPLPALPPIVAEYQLEMDEVLRRIDRLIAAEKGLSRTFL